MNEIHGNDEKMRDFTILEMKLAARDEEKAIGVRKLRMMI